MTQAYAWLYLTTTYISPLGVSTNVAEVTTVPSFGVSRENIEVTSNDSPNGFKEFIAGLREGDEVEFKMNDVPGDLGQQALAAAAEAGDTGTFIIAAKNGRSVSFSAVVNTFDLGGDSNVASISCKVKITGPIVKSTSPVKLTALVSSAGTLLPAFSADTKVYTVTAATATCTVTPTSAGAAITVNGVTVASGSPSGAISLTTGGITELNIVVSKAGNTPTAYKIIVSKAT